MLHAVTIVLALLAPVMLVLASPARAQLIDDLYSIIRPEPGKASREPSKPEPWLAPKYQSPRGTPQRPNVPRPVEPRAAMPTVPRVPPPIVVPETGRALPNQPTLSPSGPRGTESFQDRAARCAHQAGAYGEATGKRSTYIGTCVNQ